MNATHRYRHVLFDFDGVLCDSLGAAIASYNALRETRFPELPVVDGQSTMGDVYRGSLKTCLHRWLPEERAREFFDLHSKCMARSAAALGTFAGVGRMLSDLGASRASIVTSAYSEAVRTVLSRDGECAIAETVGIAGRELRQGKNEKICNLLGRSDIVAEDAIYVGDLQSDVLYCSQVPIDIIAVSYGYQDGDLLREASPTHLVGSVPELRQLLATVVG